MREYLCILAVGALACVSDPVLPAEAGPDATVVDVVSEDVVADACVPPRSANTLGVFRPDAGAFFVLKRADAGDNDFVTGRILDAPSTADQPVLGDWDGDGVVGAALFDPVSKKAYLRQNLTVPGNADETRTLAAPGSKGCVVVAGRFRACDADDLGVCCRDGATIACNLGSKNPIYLEYGSPDDQVVFGDWNGDGIDTVGVFRPSMSTFFLRNSNDSGLNDLSVVLSDAGADGARAVASDVFALGRAAVGLRVDDRFVFTAPDGGTLTRTYGVSSDIPVTGRVE